MTSWPGKNFSALGICEKTAEGQYYLAGIHIAAMYEKNMIVFSLALSTWKRVKTHTHIFSLSLEFNILSVHAYVCTSFSNSTGF